MLDMMLKTFLVNVIHSEMNFDNTDKNLRMKSSYNLQMKYYVYFKFIIFEPEPLEQGLRIRLLKKPR